MLKLFSLFIENTPQMDLPQGDFCNRICPKLVTSANFTGWANLISNAHLTSAFYPQTVTLNDY